MADCDVCEGDDNLPNRCRYCDGVFCVEHRLPEAHDCAGLKVVGASTSEEIFDVAAPEDADWVEKDRPYEVVKPETMGSTQEPEYASGPDVNPDGSLERTHEESGENAGVAFRAGTAKAWARLLGVYAKVLVSTVVQLGGWVLALFGTYDLFSRTLLAVESSSELLPALPQQEFVVLTPIDDVLIIAVGLVVIYVSTGRRF